MADQEFDFDGGTSSDAQKQTAASAGGAAQSNLQPPPADYYAGYSLEGAGTNGDGMGGQGYDVGTGGDGAGGFGYSIEGGGQGSSSSSSSSSAFVYGQGSAMSNGGGPGAAPVAASNPYDDDRPLDFDVIVEDVQEEIAEPASVVGKPLNYTALGIMAPQARFGHRRMAPTGHLSWSKGQRGPPQDGAAGSAAAGAGSEAAAAPNKFSFSRVDRERERDGISADSNNVGPTSSSLGALSGNRPYGAGGAGGGGGAAGGSIFDELGVPAPSLDKVNLPPDSHVSLFDIDPSRYDTQPWTQPSARLEQWFNYGLTENSWRKYARQQQRVRKELRQLLNAAAAAGPGGHDGQQFGQPQQQQQYQQFHPPPPPQQFQQQHPQATQEAPRPLMGLQPRRFDSNHHHSSSSSSTGSNSLPLGGGGGAPRPQYHQGGGGGRERSRSRSRERNPGNNSSNGYGYRR